MKIFFALIAAQLLLITPALARENDLVRDADGFYTFERSPRHGGWLATVTAGQFSMTLQTEELYNLFQSLGKAGFNKVRCKEASGVKISGYFVAHVLSVQDCQF